MSDVRGTFGKILVATISVCAAGLLICGAFSANGNAWEAAAKTFGLFLAATVLGTFVLLAEWAAHVYRVESAKYPNLAPVQFSLRWMLLLVGCVAIVLGWGKAHGFRGNVFVVLCIVTFSVGITPFLKTRRERAREYELRKRPELDDNSFFEHFYANTDVPRDIPIRLRKLWENVFGESMARLHPNDNLPLVYDDTDFADVCYRIECEFGLKIPKDTICEMDGSFDSVVRYLAKRRSALATDRELSYSSSRE